MKKDLREEYSSMNLYYSDTCNFNCKYCYVKTAPNPDLIAFYQSDAFYEKLKSFPNIQSINIWGGESTVNLPMFTEDLDRLRDLCPQVSRFSFSSNFSDISSILPFIKKAFERDNTYLYIQASIDGDREVFGMGRNEQKFKQVIDNFKLLLEQTKDIDLSGKRTLIFSNKGTLNREALQYLFEEENLDRHLKFFDGLIAYAEKYNRKNLNVVLSYFNSLSFPYGEYTKEDGEKLALMLNRIRDKGYHLKRNSMLYDSSMDKLLAATDTRELEGLTRCSAGIGDIGMSYDGTYHSCHRTFTSKVRVLDERKPYIAKNEEELLNIRYMSIASRNNASLQVSTAYSVIKELSQLGYCKDVTNDKMLMLMITTILQHECIMENVLNYGTYSVSRQIPLMQLLCNGAIETMREIWKERLIKK